MVQGLVLRCQLLIVILAGSILFVHPYHNLISLPQIFSSSNPTSLMIRRNIQFKRNTKLNQKNELFDEYLDDMIYSGDIEGFIRRKSRELATPEYMSYLELKMKTCEEEDEKQVIEDIIKILSSIVRKTDGLVNSHIVFEQRLDKILFKSPNKRRAFIKEILDEMTPGFIDHVQNELKSTTDIDSKLVLASVLLYIGQEKNMDLLGANAILLQRADASLGDEFAKPVASSGLIIDPSSTIPEGTDIGNRNEQILAGLIFSENEVLEDVLNNIQYIDDGFVQFLTKKIDAAKDIEERNAMTSLLKTITTVLDRLKEVELSGSDLVTKEEEVDINQLRQRMQEIQVGQNAEEINKKGGGKKTDKLEDFTVKSNRKDTFQQVLSRFRFLPEGYSLEEAVKENYELCDYQFMEMLKEEIEACYVEGADIEKNEYETLLATITKEMTSRIGNAQERLEKILKKPSPQAMESEVVAMTRRGEVDEALVLLIEANAQQAAAAGATQATEVLSKLLTRINDERERRLPDEQRLLRALIKLTDSEKRKGLLYQAFKPMKRGNSDGEIVEGPPLISPPAFINMVRTFILNFGNVDTFDIMGRANVIIDEAQIVATDLYGEGMSPRQQQQFMFEKNTVSVWDLANFEEKALMSGEEVPWRNDAFDNKDPEEVLGERVRRVGGSE